MEGYIRLNHIFWRQSTSCNFPEFLEFYPPFQMTITPMFFEQIEKFLCLKSSTTQGLSTGTLRLHMTRVQKRVLKDGQLFWSKNPQNRP